MQLVLKPLALFWSAVFAGLLLIGNIHRVGSIEHGTVIGYRKVSIPGVGRGALSVEQRIASVRLESGTIVEVSVPNGHKVTDVRVVPEDSFFGRTKAYELYR